MRSSPSSAAARSRSPSSPELGVALSAADAVVADLECQHAALEPDGDLRPARRARA